MSRTEKNLQFYHDLQTGWLVQSTSYFLPWSRRARFSIFSSLLSHVIVHHIIPWSIKSTLQAFTVQLLEENLGSTYANISVAPAPRDILWQNMKSPAYLWSYILFFATILIVISCIALSPVIFAKNIQETIFNILNVDVHLFKGSCRILAMLLNSILFFTFTLLTPYFVKVAMKRTYKLFPSS